ncbi:MAG: NADH-quinone oxidoreductase subunit NuoF [Gammaproteobacteria bacterium]|nr:NADH-quinone oxidoreductase subunit NuoF [Gammaproteobacteria bacterium]
MSISIYIPRDTTANARGADDIALLIEQSAERFDLNIKVIRNSSRGLYWLEPLVEVDTEAGRIAFGPVTEKDVSELFEQQFYMGQISHKLCLGLTEEIPFLKKQQRLTFARAGITEPLNLDDYLSHDGFKGLKKALSMNCQTIVDEVKGSGLRGRGGAAFPTGIKWQTVLDSSAEQKYVVCNADEGDSGTFSDRMILEGDPFVLIEGMCIAGIAVGATQGYIYIRSEYPLACDIFTQAIQTARQAGYLGSSICGTSHSFDIHVRVGAGAYICGEETSLLESLEGKRGMVRVKPPLPALSGLFGEPTVVNNVISLASVPVILDKGADYYEHYGQGRSRGTLPFQLAGNIKQSGLVELSFGHTLRELLEIFGQGTRTGKAIRAVQVGGPLGAYLPESLWDLPLDYELFSEAGAVLGHGGIVVFDDSINMTEMARYAMEFCALESCGKCTPCRIGSVRGVELIDKLLDSEQQDEREEHLNLLDELCDTMEEGSLCAMGGMTPFPVRSIFKYFAQDLDKS